MNIEGQPVAILGAGRSGEAAAKLAASRGARVVVHDSGDAETLSPVAGRLEAAGVGCVFGAEPSRSEAGLFVLSPGIDPGSAFVRALVPEGASVLGEVEFASRFWHFPLIGITGTNGKTTCTELTAHLFNECGTRALPAGNHGKPLSEVVAESDGQPLQVVLELSSFQLEAIDQFHPETTVWLNFAPDHMDRYEKIEDYEAAKCGIYRNQEVGDLAVVNALNPPSVELRSRTVTFSSYTDEADFTYRNEELFFHDESVCRMEETRLTGRHNAENLMAALAVGHHHGLDFDRMRARLESYQPPHHRCELVGRVRGVPFLNDSKATNFHALESSLKAQDARVVLIAGGKEKGLSYESLLPLVEEKVDQMILIGEIRHQLAELFRTSAPCHAVDSLEEAVKEAAALCEDGQVVLFSPGTSSFDMFRSYEARGDHFRSLVTQLQQTS